MGQFDELPEGWGRTTLGAIFSWSNGKGLTKKQMSGGEYRVYGGNGIAGSHTDWLSERAAIVVGRVGAQCGNVHIAPAKSWITDNAIYSSFVSENIFLEFFYYLLRESKLNELAGGSGQPYVSQSLLNPLEILLPPLNEQRRIVEKIEALTARSRKARGALEAIPALLDQFRQSVLAAAFRGDLTADWREQNPDVEPAEELLEQLGKEDGLPHGWCRTSLGSIIKSLKYGTSKKCSYEENGVPVLRIPNVGEGVIRHDDLKYAELTDKETQDLSLISGDILLIRSNGSVSLVGKTALARESEKGFAYAGYLIRVRPNKQLVIPEYLNFCLSSYDLRTQIEVPARSTSGVHNINSKEVQNLQIPLAPLEEQKEIVRKILDFYSANAQLELIFDETLAEQEQLDQSILAKAFRGELVPQDPNDEPASVLLERIRVEREKLGGKKRAKSKG